MTRWHADTLFALVLALATSATAAEQDSLEPLDEALKAVAGFEHGKDSGPLVLVERAVVEAARKPEMRQAVEQRLLESLRSAATRDAKAFLCRQLRTVATARSVPQLEAMLTAPDLSHMARYALESIEDPAAAAALRRALGKTSGKLQSGILNTLGRRRCREALPDVTRLLGSPETAVGAAAAAALGNIGGADAVKALEAARPGAPVELRLSIDDALMACAEGFLARGEKAEAARIYETFYTPQRATHLRIGALGGLVAARGADAVTLIVDAMKNRDPEIRASAIGFARDVKGRDATRVLASRLSSLPPDAQELLMRALSARADAEAASAIVAATKSEHAGVRLVAYESLGSVGDASVVDLLLRAAAGGGGEQQAARASLLRLSGDDVNGAIVRATASRDPKIRVEGIRALAGRRAASAFGQLARLAEDDEASVRTEAIGALGRLAGESELAALMELAVKPKESKDRPAVEQAVAATFRRVSDPERQARPVLAVLSGAPVEAKPSLLRLLGKTGTPSALRAVRAALKDDDAAIRDAALHTLSGWPEATPAEELLRLARTLSDGAQRTVALRGYIRMANLSEDPAGMYARAMTLAERPDDRRLVLDGLGTTGSTAALELVEPYLEDRNEKVRAAAALATVEIADRIRSSDAERARASLRAVMAQVKDPAIGRKAQDVINEMDKYQGYILTWLVSGPYREKGKESRGIFDAVLSPEKPDAQDVAWKRLRRGVGPWDINLETALGQLDHCAAYVRTRVWSTREQDARLELGSDDSIKAWLNGKLVHANYTSRGLAPRQDLTNVKLREGWNDLLLKVVDHQGGWGFCCRVRKPDGTAMDGLKVEAR